MARYSVKYLDKAGNEVLKKDAKAALVTERDNEGNVVSETIGDLEPEVADQS